MQVGTYNSHGMPDRENTTFQTDKRIKPNVQTHY